jgi:hypothetical protein
MSKTSSNELEALLLEAHAKLQLVPLGANASKEVILALFGSFEVRLLQLMSVPPQCEVRFWMELFDRDRQLSIDSVGDRVLEDAATVAAELIARAAKLGENPHTWRRPTESFFHQTDNLNAGCLPHNPSVPIAERNNPEGSGTQSNTDVPIFKPFN